MRRWWAVTGSNRRPSRCKRDALPAELTARKLPRATRRFGGQACLNDGDRTDVGEIAPQRLAGVRCEFDKHAAAVVGVGAAHE